LLCDASCDVTVSAPETRQPVSKMTIAQIERFRVHKATLDAAIAGMGWPRFRHSYKYNGSANDSMQLTFPVQLRELFACPAGEPTSASSAARSPPLTTTPRSSTRSASAAATFADLYLPGAPQAASDGTFSVWVDIGSGSAASCAFGTATWTIPEAYLDAAVSADNKICLRWDLNDTCAGGTGCESYNDPCVRNAHLTFPR